MSGLVGVDGGSVGYGRLDGGLGDGEVLRLDVGCCREMDVAVEWVGHEVMGFVDGMGGMWVEMEMKWWMHELVDMRGMVAVEKWS
ncbi:hypothetical protein ACJRO7_014872 [Eucalyptus globulus]|uniref:Uncharacterized protein n=1 Tax=Eucalyptus globulus TaxID=34317 RepID=A0ABD3L7N9_EUCGL